MPHALHRLLLATLTLALLASALPTAAAENSGKLYELRLYTANEGKLPDLHARFRDHTMKLFEKHGMENIIYWTVSEGTRQDDAKNMLVYIIAHKDKAAADASWAAFRADPDWQAAAKKSEENGKLLASPPVSIFMSAVDYSPDFEPANKNANAAPRLFELRKYNTGEAGLPGTVERFRDGEADLFKKHNMPPLGLWTTADNTAFIYLLAHKDRETSKTNWAAFITEFRPWMTEYNAKRRAAEPQPAQPANAQRPARGPGGGNEIRFLIPTDYSPRK